MNKFHKPITTQYHTPSSKPYRIYLDCIFGLHLKIFAIQQHILRPFIVGKNVHANKIIYDLTHLL
jgi:hypothetical protein